MGLVPWWLMKAPMTPGRTMEIDSLLTACESDRERQGRPIESDPHRVLAHARLLVAEYRQRQENVLGTTETDNA